MTTAPAARRRVRLTLLVVLVALVAVPAAAVLALLYGIDARTYAPLILDRVRLATGRDVVVGGAISLKPSLWPTITLHDVSVANPPGFPAGPMLTVARAEVELSLLPLLSRQVEIRRLVLVEPHLALQTDPQGRGNWTAAPAGASAASPPPPAQAQPVPSQATLVYVRKLTIEDGEVSWQPSAASEANVLIIKHLDAASAGATAPVSLSGTFDWRGAPVEAQGEVGSMARLQDRAASTPWPVKLTLIAGTARLNIAGDLSRPEAGRGYDLRLDASVPQLADLAPYVPVATLPNLRGVAFAGTLADAGEAGPGVRDATLDAGATDLDAVRPGLALVSLHAVAPAMDKPVRVTAELQARELPVRADATLGTPLALLQVGNAALPVAASVDVAGSHLSATGTLARPLALAGADLAVSGHVADLAAFAPLVGTALPAIKDLAMDAQVADMDGFANGVTLGNLHVTAPEGDAAGDARLAFTGRPSLTATLMSRRLEWDALSPLIPKPGAATPAPAVGQPAAPVVKSGRVIPDTKLPFGALKLADIDLRLRADLLHAGGTDYHGLVSRVLLKDGRLSVDPAAIETPEGHLEAGLDVDTSQPATAVAFTLRAPALAIKPLLTGLRLSDDAAGTLEVDADLHGSGDTPRALAATATGHLGAAMVDGQIDNRVILDLVGPLLHAANLPEELALGAARGRSTVRCMALRLEAANGQATERAFVLDTDKLQLVGSGAINLADETLSLKLRPEVKWSGGRGVVVPLLIGGTLAKPGVRVDPAGAADPASPLAALAEALAGQKLPALNGADPCPAALALARGGKGGAEPAPVPARPQAPAAGGEPAAKPPKPIDLLKSLLR